MPYRKVYHHVRRHRKKYLRFIVFFLFLILYGVVEDFISLTIHGVEFNLVVFSTVFVIALIFTIVAEVTEKLAKKETPKIKKFITKEEKVIKKIIKKEEKKLKEKIKK
jgi:DMSO reductase anchor subunit